MSQNYKDHLDRLLDHEPVTSDNIHADASAYPNVSNTRNLLLVMADSNRKFLNYSFLISGDYLKSEGYIRLEFTTHIVTMKGLQLEQLYNALFEHRVKIIVCRDARYNALEGEGFVVNEMVVVSN